LREVRVLTHLGEAVSREPQRLVDELMAAATTVAGGEHADDAAIIAVSLAARPRFSSGLA